MGKGVVIGGRAMAGGILGLGLMSGAALAQAGAEAWVAALYVDGVRSCSAVLVARDEALTAAHCVAGRLPQTIAIVPGLGGPESTARREVRSIRLPPGHVPLAQALTPEGLGTDLALLRLAPLAQPDGPPAPDPTRIEPWPEPAGDFADILGYERDGPDHVTRREGCMALAEAAGVVTLACDVVSGLSGAPVFRQTRPEGAPALVGILSARSPGRAYALTIAGRLEALRAAP